MRLSESQMTALRMIDDEADRFQPKGGGVAGSTLRSLMVRGLVREVGFQGELGLTQAGHSALRAGSPVSPDVILDTFTRHLQGRVWRDDRGVEVVNKSQAVAALRDSLSALFPDGSE